MKILIVSQYFWPENFRINDLAMEMARRGHEVTVLTGVPNYPAGEVFPEFSNNPDAFGALEGVEIVRVPHPPRGRSSLALMLNYLMFALSACLIGPWKLRGRDFDAIFVAQMSPVTVGLPAIVLKWIKRIPIAFWVLDLWPQSLEAVGAVRSPFVLGLVELLVRFIYRQCDRILVQSRSFFSEVRSKSRSDTPIIYFPSWAETAPSIKDVSPAPEIPTAKTEFNIVFAGNIGEAQDFGAVLAAADIVRDEDIRWIIVGSGRKSEWLASEVTRLGLHHRVVLAGRYPLDRMPSFYRHADAVLVSLRDEPIFALTIPGKVQGYLAAGLPILAMVNGEANDLISRSGAGLAVSAGDSAGLAAAVRQMKNMSAEELAQMSESGRKLTADEFHRDKLITELEATLSQMITE